VGNTLPYCYVVSNVGNIKPIPMSMPHLVLQTSSCPFVYIYGCDDRESASVCTGTFMRQASLRESRSPSVTWKLAARQPRCWGLIFVHIPLALLY
jgi:hypothetical protein